MQNNPPLPAEISPSKDNGRVERNDAVESLKRPLGVFVVAVVVGLEALGLGVTGVGSVVAMFTQPVVSLSSAIFLVVLLLGLSVALSAVAVNSFKGFRWTRSAAFVWQLLMVAIAMPVLVEGKVLLGLALLLPPVAVVFFLFTPKVVAFSLRIGTSSEVL